MEAKSLPFFTDTHAHLASSRFSDGIEPILERARKAGVGRILSISCDEEDVAANLKLSALHPGVFATAGVHPCYVHEVGGADWPERMRALATRSEIVAIGEIGLDFYHPPQDGGSVDAWRTRQHEVFEAMLQLAADLAKPVVVHQRESGPEVLAVLARFPTVRAVLHCFTGGPTEAEKALAAGHWLSFTGVLTYPKSTEIREAAALVPTDRILLETDSPYLAPIPFRGKSCEPAMVRQTAITLAEVKGLSLDEIADLTSRNAERFFGLEGASLLLAKE